MFDSSLSLTRQAHVLVVSGPVDEYAVPDLREHLDALLADETAAVVDVSAAEFLPSAAIGLLLSMRGRARRAGAALTIVAAAGTYADQTLSQVGAEHDRSLPPDA